MTWKDKSRNDLQAWKSDNLLRAMNKPSSTQWEFIQLYDTKQTLERPPLPLPCGEAVNSPIAFQPLSRFHRKSSPVCIYDAYYLPAPPLFPPCVLWVPVPRLLLLGTNCYSYHVLHRACGGSVPWKRRIKRKRPGGGLHKDPAGKHKTLISHLVIAKKVITSVY